MKTDRKLFTAVLVLIGLVIWLVVLSLQKDLKAEQAIQMINELKSIKQEKPQVLNGINGKTPVLGIDYFNGRDGTGKDGRDGPNGQDGRNGESAYQIAVRHGFTGNEEEWLASQKGADGKSATELLMDCVDGFWVKKYAGDDFWQPSKIRCEVAHE